MKKHLLSIITTFVFLTSIAIAQPVLTDTAINPVAGEVFSIKDYAVSCDPGGSGANQYWWLMPVGSTTTIAMSTYPASSTPYGSSFPLSNICMRPNGAFWYYATSSLALINYGVASSSDYTCYNDPEDILRFPFNLGNTYTDTWYGTSHNSGTAITGTSTVTYDGYGAITLPAGTYYNVMRVHYSKIWSNSTFSYTTERYSWYLNGHHLPIAETYTITDPSNVHIGTSLLTLSTNTAISVPEYESLSPYITSYPNPAVNEINFELSNMVTVKEVELIDITGKLVYSKEISQSMIDKGFSINTSNFEDGIYFAKFKLEDGQTLAKKIHIVK
jgi:hypothetical protein